MGLFGQATDRRASNAKALAAFGVRSAPSTGGLYRVVRDGGPVTVFTIGYERRGGDDLVAALRDAGIEHLADIREKPISRKPQFRAAALRAICEDAGVEYGAWKGLGSTESQRDRLQDSGDLDRFHRTFRAYAVRSLSDDLDRLAAVARVKVVALLCYERAHEDCHRSVVADLLADRLRGGITAIV